MVSKSAPLFALIFLMFFAQTVESSPVRGRAFIVFRGDAESAIAAAEAAGEQAFLELRDACGEGGDVVALAARFNEALELLERARVFAGGGLLDRAVESAESAEGLFIAVGGEAESLRVQAAAEALVRRNAVLVAAPVAAFLMTVFFYVLIRSWQARRLERTMEMEIEEAGA